MPKPLIALLAIALAACTGGGGGGSPSSGTDVTTPGTAVISDHNISSDAITISWAKTEGADAESWSVYHNDSATCSAELNASDDDQQSGSCSFTLIDGNNSIYVQLCNSGDACSTSETLQIEHSLAPGAIYLEQLPASTTSTELEVTWIKEQGANGDLWYIFHNGQSACSGSFALPSEQQLQSASCSIDLDFGEHQLQARLCIDKPVHSADVCSDSAVYSLTSYFDSALELATPAIEALAASLPALATTINWSKNTEDGSAGESWTLYRNNAVACRGTLAADEATGSCSLTLQEGSNSLFVRLCTDVATYSGATCVDSALVEVEGTAPYALEPGTISINGDIGAQTYEPSLIVDWAINSGNGVSQWYVQLNDSSRCLSSSANYLVSGSCLVDLELGVNTISVTGCNYGQENTQSCTTSAELSIEYIASPGTPEITSSLPATTYASEHNLSWQRTEGEPAAYWLVLVNDTSKCSGDLLEQTPQSASCVIELDSGINAIIARLCLANESGSAYCSDSELEQVELLAPVPSQPVISTPEHSVAEDIDSIVLEWSKSSGANGSYWSSDNNGASVAACSDQPILSSGSSQSGFCSLPLALGANLVSVRLCEDNAAGTASCSTSESVSIVRGAIVLEFTSASSASSAENTSEVFYTATVSADGSPTTPGSFSLSGVDSALFSIDSSGELAFINPPDFEAAQDYDQDNTYELNISATYLDYSTSLEFSVSVIDSNDETPQVPNPEASTTHAIAAITLDSVIYTVEASDADADDILTYSLSGVDASHFDLNSSSGELRFAQLPSIDQPQDFDGDNTYDLAISVSDAAANSTSLTLAVIAITESAPEFSSESASVEFSENSAAIVYDANATDADGDSLSYSLTGLDSAHFNLDPASGQLSFSQAPDFETPQDYDQDNTYELAISATDNTHSIALDLNVSVSNVNEAHYFESSSSSFTLSENDASSIALPIAIDPDASNAISYELLAIAEGNNDYQQFNLSQDSAPSIAFADPAGADYENISDHNSDHTYEFILRARDAIHSASLDINVTITNRDDNLPTFTNPNPDTISVPENTSATTIIYTASAIDQDGDAITYALSGTDATHFILSSTTGALNFAASPDFENPQDQDGDNDYHIEIQATSSNNGVKSTASLQLSISVTDIDETPPYFTDADSVVTLVEDPETEGQQIAVLALEFAVYDDADDAAGRALSLELEGDDSSLFQISTSAANNHQVHFITSPDYDHTHDANQDCNYSFSVVATDSDGNEAKHSATIVITGVIDEAPYIDPASYTRGEIIAIAGNDTDPFLTLAGYDEDRSSWNYQTESWRYRDNFDTLSFTLTSTIAESDSDLFLLDPDTLELSLKESLDPENPQQRGGTDNLYQVEVAIIDSAGNSNLTDGSDTASRIVYVQVGEFVDKGSEPVDSGPQIPWFSSSEISLLSEKVDIAIPWVIHVGEGAISWEMYVNGELECSYAVFDLSSPVTSGHCMVAADKFKTYSTANNAWVIVCYLDNTCAQSETAIFGYAADVSYHPNYNFSYENPGTAADCGEVEIGDPVTHDNNTRCYNYLLETDSFGGKYYRSGLTYLDHDFGYNFDVVAYFIEWGVYARDFDPHDMPVDYLSTILYSFIKFEGDNTTANDECENCTFSGAVAIADTWAALDKPFYWPGAEEYYADQAETEEELAEVLAEKADMTGRGIFQQFWLLKQKFPRLQTCLSVGGWTFSRPFPLVASDPAKRAVFAESIVDMAVEYHFDCIDIDWEFPGKAGGDRVATHDGVATYDLDGDGISPFVDPSPADADYFVALIAELRAEIDSRAEAKHIEINSAVYTSSEGMALMNYGAFADDLDGIHMMTYDYYGAWDPHTGLQAALYANTDPVSDDVATAYGNPYNPQHNIASAMARGVNNAINNGFRSELSVSEANSGIRQKIVPGLAFYGRNYSGVNMDEPVPGKYMVRATGTTGNSDGSAEQLGWEPGNLNYAQIEGYYNHGSSVKGNADYDAGGYSTADREWTYNWDDESQTPFLYDADTASFVTYSDPRAIYYQTCHAAWHNSKGVMFWEISGDSEDFDLVAAIHAALSGEPLDDYRYNPQPSCTDLDTIDYGDIAYGPGAYADLSGIKDLQDLEDYGYISQEILDSLFFFNEEYHSDYLYGSIVNEECTDYNFLSDWEALKQTASEHFPKFASEGSIEDRLRELAAFFAFTAEYTMYGRDWGFYKLDPNKNVVYQDGYCHKEPPECADQSSCDQKCDADDEEYGYACSLGNSYHSRGHFHLSGSHNYGAMSEALFGDNDYTLLENPDLLATDVNLSWSSALWYWMNHEERELPYDDIPSPHNAILGNFTAEPEWGRYPGLGFVTAVLSAYNGGDQCDEDSWRHGFKSLEPPAKHRLGFYLTYLNILSSTHIKYGYEPLSPWVTDTEGNTHGVYPATYAEFDLNEDDLIDRYTDVKKYLTCADMLAYD